MGEYQCGTSQSLQLTYHLVLPTMCCVGDTPMKLGLRGRVED